jgi:hypothetical protein
VQILKDGIKRKIRNEIEKNILIKKPGIGDL